MEAASQLPVEDSRTQERSGKSPAAAPPVQPTPGAERPSPLETEAISTPLQGFKDSFLEQRFRANGEIKVAELASSGELTFLSKVTQVDEYYRVAKAPRQTARLPPAGLYRIRNEGAPQPFVTVKQQGDGKARFSTTIDIVSPTDTELEVIRRFGELVAVIEKERITYRMKKYPDCLLNQDAVGRLGDYIDLKADSPETMERFLALLKPDPAQQVEQSYLQMKEAQGIRPLHLQAWQFHEKFKDYLIGVISGTLTPLGFLTATLASNQSKTAMVIALLSAGLTDGLADSVATSQSSQSSSQTTAFTQAKLFLKTMAGKCILPLCYIPFVAALDSNLAIAASTSTFGAAILSFTSAVQALAKEKAVIPAVAKLLGWGSLAIGAGFGLGKLVPPLLSSVLGG